MQPPSLLATFAKRLSRTRTRLANLAKHNQSGQAIGCSGHRKETAVIEQSRLANVANDQKEATTTPSNIRRRSVKLLQIRLILRMVNLSHRRGRQTSVEHPSNIRRSTLTDVRHSCSLYLISGISLTYADSADRSAESSACGKPFDSLLRTPARRPAPKILPEDRAWCTPAESSIRPLR